MTRVFALVAALSLAGCQLFLDESKLEPAATGRDAGPDAGAPDAAPADGGGGDAGGSDGGGSADGGTDGGSGPDAGSDAGVDAGADAGAPPAPALYIGPHAAPCGADTSPTVIFYVDPLGGSDGNGGTSAAAPKRHLSAALALAKASGASSPTSEVRICAGTNDELVTLDFPISVKGGYVCGTWTRSPGCFDPSLASASPPYFGPGAPAAMTILANSQGASASNAKTLLVSGSAIGSAVAIDGLTVIAPSGGVEVHALETASGASPVISNCILDGAGGSLPPGALDQLGSVGLAVAGGAPEIRHNLIQGGKASLSASGHYFGSVGLFLSSGASSPHVHDNAILGGSGALLSSGQAGSVGLFADNPQAALSRAAGSAIESNWIFGGTGNATASGSTTASSVGVWFLWSCTHDIDLVGNFIHGGSSTGTAGSRGIHSDLGGNGQTAGSLIAGNKIYGGDSTNGSAPITAIALTGAHGQTTVANNFIYAGNKSGSASGPLTGIDFAHVQFNPTRVAHNLIYAGGNGNGRAYPVTVENDANGGHQISIDNNILAGNQNNSGGVLFNQCPASGSLVPGFHANLFLNQDQGYGVYGAGVASPCTPNATFATLAGLEAQLGTAASGNYSFRKDCSGDPSHCAVRSACDPATAPSCLQDLLLSWDLATNGYADLLTVQSWNINPTPASGYPSCHLIDSAYNDWAPAFPFNLDIFQNPRVSAGVAVGPVQLAAPCVP